MNVCIIGANSFLANAIIIKLKNNPECKFVLFGKKSNFNFIHSNKYTFYKYVIPDNEIDISILLEADIIIYCAGAGVQAYKSYSLNEIYQVNTFEPIKLINNLSLNQYKGKVITFGSYFEIGNALDEIYYTEEQYINNSNQLPNDYCISKKILTNYISQKLPKITFTLTHLVLPNIYGYGENPNRLIPYLVDCIKKNKPVQLSSGTQKRQYLHVNDVADVVYRALNETFAGVFNLTVKEVISVKELVEKVIMLAKNKKGLEVNFGSISKRDMGMQFLALSPDKVEKVFNWKAKTVLEEGIKEYFDKIVI